MKPELVIFDFWNTLAFAADYDPQKFFARLGDFSITIKGKAETESFSRAFSKMMCFARGWDDFSGQLLKEFGKNQRAEDIGRFADFLRDNVAYKIYDDVEAVSNLPYKKSILTDSAKFLVESADLQGFGEIFTPAETGSLKPDPKVFLKVLESFGVSAAKTVMVGDDPERDIAPAQKLGIKTILIDRKNKFPNSPGARIASMAELQETIEGL